LLHSMPQALSLYARFEPFFGVFDVAVAGAAGDAAFPLRNKTSPINAPATATAPASAAAGKRIA